MLVHVTELIPHGARATVGFPLNGAYFDVPLPVVLDGPLTDDGECLRVAPTDIASAPLAPAALTRFVKSLLPRYERGPFAEGDAIERRRKLATEGKYAAPVALPLRGILPETCTARSVIEKHLRMRIEGLALPPEVAASTVQFVGPHAKSWTEEEIFAIAREIAADDEGCLIPWDTEGRKDDARIAREEEARRQAEAARVVQENRDAQRNSSSCADLGVVVFRFPRKVFEPSLLEAGRSEMLLPSILTLSTPPLYRDADYVYFAFNERAFVGLPIPAGQLHSSVGEVMPPAFVPHATRKELRERTLYQADDIAASVGASSPMQDFIVSLRGGKFSKEPITEFRDGSTPEGVWAEEIAERTCAPWMRQAKDGFFRMLVLNVMLRGVRLRPDCAQALFERMAKPHGIALPADRFNELAAQVIDGTRALVGPDEMWEEPEDPSVWDRLRGIFAPDEWRSIVESVLESRPPRVRSETLENALRTAGAIDRPMTARQHGRMKRLMARLGWEKKIVTVNGERFQAFVPKGKP